MEGSRNTTLCNVHLQIYEDYSNMDQAALKEDAVRQISNAAIKPGVAVAEEKTSGLIMSYMPAYLKNAHPVFYYHDKEFVKKELSGTLNEFFRDKTVSEISPLPNQEQRRSVNKDYHVSRSFEIMINGVPHQIDVLDVEKNSNINHFNNNSIRRPAGGNWENKRDADELFPAKDSQQIIMLDLFEYGISTNGTVGKVFDKSTYTELMKNRDKSGHELHPAVVISQVKDSLV